MEIRGHNKQVGIVKGARPILQLSFSKIAHFPPQPMINFTAEKCYVWKILLKMFLVMVSVIAYTERQNILLRAS